MYCTFSMGGHHKRCSSWYICAIWGRLSSFMATAHFMVSTGSLFVTGVTYYFVRNSNPWSGFMGAKYFSREFTIKMYSNIQLCRSTVIWIAYSSPYLVFLVTTLQLFFYPSLDISHWKGQIRGKRLFFQPLSLVDKRSFLLWILTKKY